MPLRRRTAAGPSVGTPAHTEEGIAMAKHGDKSQDNGSKKGGGSRVFIDPSKGGGKHSGGNDKGKGGKSK